MNDLRVVLINPSLKLAEIGHYSEEVEKNRGSYPPLGLGYVASQLEKYGHVVEIIDLEVQPELMTRLPEILSEKSPDIVGFYTMTWTFQQVDKISREIKTRIPDTVLVMGGPNVCSFPKESLEYSIFDYAVVGEGEKTIIELMDNIEDRGAGIDSIKGVVYRKDGKVVVNESRELIRDLDEISFPAWHLLPISEYFDVFSREKNFATIITSRGCPYNCAFCDRVNRMGKQWRSRSPENIIKEMKKLRKEYGINEFMFFDDNFIIDTKRVHKFCNLILKEKLGVIWECRARVDVVDKPLLEKMKKAGCYRIRYGMESGDNQILQNLKKDITVEQIKRASKLTKDAGIEIFAYFMMGSPGETKETLEKTRKLALKINPDFVAFSRTILIVGSELYEWGIQNNQIKKDYWKKYLKGEETDSAPAISTPELPDKEVEEYISKSENQFYLRPKYITKRLKNIRTPYQLKKQGKMGIQMIKKIWIKKLPKV